MRILTPWIISRWQERMLNIHPALLPAFKGLHTHERVLADGAREHGATVHFVVPEMDSGPIIAQGRVPVLPGDDAATLAARVLAVEHRIYPLALKLAKAAVEVTKWKNYAVVDTYARALFETGDVKGAIETQEKAVAAATDEDDKAELQEALDKYKKVAAEKV